MRRVALAYLASGWPVLVVSMLVVSMMVFPELVRAQAAAAQPDSAQQTSVDTNSRTAPAAALSSLAGMQEEGASSDTASTLPAIPSLLGGTGISGTFLTELQRSNYLRGGFNVGASYDSNALLAASNPIGNTSESIFPNLRIEETSARVRWSLGYAGGLTVNQKITTENEGSHNLNFDSQFRLSPHVNLRLAENFSITTGFFDPGTGAGTVATGGPNGSLITPIATQRATLTTVETNYHFALNDLVGASGSFYDLSFSNVPNANELTTSLTGSQTATGSGFWLHRLLGGDWAGVSYRFDRITFSGGESRVQSFYAVNTLNLSQRFTLTGFIGPQYSENQGLAPGGLPLTANAWSVAGGVEGGWQNERTSFTTGYSRSVTDGGGILGAVRLGNVHAYFRRQISTGWGFVLNASYGTNQALTAPPSSIDVTSAGFTVERNVARTLGLRMGYDHDFQQASSVPSAASSSLQTFNASRNRFFVTLSYQWSKPLGM